MAEPTHLMLEDVPRFYARARRALKSRWTKASAPHRPIIHVTHERYGRETVVVLFSPPMTTGAKAPRFEAEYGIDQGKLVYLAAGPARAARERADMMTSIDNLDGEDLIGAALASLHSLNRRAKHIRPVTVWETAYTYGDTPVRQRAPRVARIYEAKDHLLEALCLVGRAKVETFDYERQTKHMTCESCGRNWYGGTSCYECHSGSGVAEIETQTWYVIDCGGGYRFHRPTASDAVRSMAVRVKPHDPHQEPREIPEVRIRTSDTCEFRGVPDQAAIVAPTQLTEEGQLYCVERAIFWLMLLKANFSPHGTGRLA